MSAQILLFVLLFAAFLVSLFGTIDMQGFLSKVQIVNETEELSAFKSLVRRQMYLSLGLTIAYWGSMLLGIWALAIESWRSGQYGILGALILMNVIATAFRKKVRSEVQNVPAGDKGMEGMLQAVCVQWVHRSLPEF